MTILSYSRLRLQIATFIFAMSSFVLIARWWLTANVDDPWTRDDLAEGIQLEWVYPFTFLITAAIVARLMVLLAGDLAAVRALSEGLEVTGFFGRRVVRWDTLIGGHRVNYGNFMHRNRWFNIRYHVEGATRVARVPLILTKRPSGGQMSLSEKIDRARADAHVRRPAVAEEGPAADAPFDPDAAIRRYLKAKAEGQVADSPGASPALSAEVGGAEEPLPPAPRPVFGRKGL